MGSNLSLNGRIGRMQWWIGSIIALFILIIAVVVAALLLGAGFNYQSMGSVTLAMLGSLVVFPLLAWYQICLAVKRYHDLDKSGWWYLIVFIPIVGPIWQLIELGFLPGADGSNSYDGGPARFSSSFDAEIAAIQAGGRFGNDMPAEPAGFPQAQVGNTPASQYGRDLMAEPRPQPRPAMTQTAPRSNDRQTTRFGQKVKPTFGQAVVRT